MDFKEYIDKSIQAKKAIDPRQIDEAAELLVEAMETNKILICGNGGSAADSQHFAAEIVGRFRTDRMALPAIALTTDNSILTAIANDYGYEYVFSRQVDALGKEGDILIAISTSGNSKNVIEAVLTAKNKGLFTIGLLGKDGGKLKDLVDLAIIVPVKDTSHIQEVHEAILHYFALRIEEAIENE